METLRTNDVKVAATYLRAGKLVAFPTETVYGLGAHAFDSHAVARIFEAKGRPADNPLIVHVAEYAALSPLVAAIPTDAKTILSTFAPGSISVILPRHPDVPSIVSGGLDTLAVRIPSHPIAQAFLRETALPVAAPSANSSGRPSPTTWEAVAEDLDGRIDCILQGPPSDVGIESTVVDCTGPWPVILRAGSVTLADLQCVVPTTQFADTKASDANKRSPGTRYRHYAPTAYVYLVDSMNDIADTVQAGYIGLEAFNIEHPFQLVAQCTSLEDYSHRLFAFFRACDRAGIRTIYCQRVPDVGLGRALMDRIGRAAQASSGSR